MAASGVADIAIGLEGFQQAHADDPEAPDDPGGGETAAEALGRRLAGNPHLTALLALL